MPIIIEDSTITAQQLADYCGSDVSADVNRALALAKVMVADTFSAAYRAVPEAVVNQVVLEVGAAIRERSDSPSGGAQGVDYGTGQAVRTAKDPFAQCWPIVRRYVMPF